LYLRYTCDPEELWKWFEPYLEDPEEFNASANPSIKTCDREIGSQESEEYADAAFGVHGAGLSVSGLCRFWKSRTTSAPSYRASPRRSRTTSKSR